jgi:hypothetical protein
MILNDSRFDFHGDFKNQSQIKSPYLNIIFKISQSSHFFVKSSIKSLNTLEIEPKAVENLKNKVSLIIIINQRRLSS